MMKPHSDGSDSEPSGGTADSEPALLPISEVSRRTGIPVAGLRNWEQRYGLPRPQRSASGQRRYRESDCDLLAEVLRGRASGLSLPAAMDRALASASGGGPDSIFAALRHRHPGLRTHVTSKPLMLALTRAIEDECCARAQRPVLIGAFQRRDFFEASRARWSDLARSSEQTVVFADFGPRANRAGPPGPLAEIVIPDSSPMHREWVLICDAPDHPACIAGWERPGQGDRVDRDRVFETVWSVDPPVVRSAARIGIAMAATSHPELSQRLEARLGEQAEPGSADLRRASGLIERTLDYLAR